MAKSKDLKTVERPLKISLGKLEIARENPKALAQALYANDGGGGNKSFIGCLKNVVRSYHENRETESLALNRLNEKLAITFNSTKENIEKSKRFCDSFIHYAEEYSKLEIGIDRFQVNLNWELQPKRILTGHSPFLCSNEEINIAYFFQEKSNNWDQQLKFPLLQIYLSEKFYKCEVEKTKVGIYNVADKKFEFRCYEDFELDNALEEAKSIFKNVKLELDKI